jgi:putative oxidoreductase
MSTRQDTTTESNFVIKPLAPVYAAAEPYMLPLLRIVTGLWLLPHGLPKVFGGAAGTGEFLESVGYSPGIFWAWAIALTEVIGGLLLAAGFLTRLAAFAIFVFMVNAAIFHSQNGFLWGDGGWEYPAMWAVAALVFVVRGGGNLSVDRAIGREI